MSYIQILHDLCEGRVDGEVDSLPVFQDHLFACVKLGGTLPVSRSLQAKVRQAVSREQILVEEIAKLLCLDLVTPLRYLTLWNQTFYGRGQKTTSLEAAISQLGMMRVADRMEELGTVADLRKIFHGRALALHAYQHALVEAWLSLRIARELSPRKRSDATPFLLSSLLQSGNYLLALVRPHYYACCLLESWARPRASINKSFRKVLGVPAQKLGFDLAHAIGLPKSLADLVLMLDAAPWNRKSWLVENTPENQILLNAAYVSHRIGAEMFSFRDSHRLSALLRDLEGKGKITKVAMESAPENTIRSYLESFSALDLVAFRLPSHLEVFEDEIVGRNGAIVKEQILYPTIAKRLNPFLFEIKAAIKAGANRSTLSRAPQAVAATLLALVRAMEFERAVLFLRERTENVLKPAYLFGREVLDLEAYTISLEEALQHSPVLQAYENKEAVFHGDPIFGGDWPLVAFPLLNMGRVEGVFYADKRQTKRAAPLATDEELACLALAEVWQQSV